MPLCTLHTGSLSLQVSHICGPVLPATQTGCSPDVHCKAAADLSSSSRHRLGLKVYSLVMSTRRVSRLSPGSVYGWRLVAALLRAITRCCSSGTPRSLQGCATLKQQRHIGGPGNRIFDTASLSESAPARYAVHDVANICANYDNVWHSGNCFCSPKVSTANAQALVTYALPSGKPHLPGVLCKKCMTSR